MAWPACPERRPRSRGRRTGEPLAASPCKAQGQSADLSHAGLAGTGKASFFPCIRILPALHQIKISLSEGRSCRNFHNSPQCYAVLDRPWEGPYVLIASLLQSGRRQHRRQKRLRKPAPVPVAASPCRSLRRNCLRMARKAREERAERRLRCRRRSTREGREGSVASVMGSAAARENASLPAGGSAMQPCKPELVRPAVAECRWSPCTGGALHLPLRLTNYAVPCFADPAGDGVACRPPGLPLFRMPKPGPRPAARRST